MAAPTIYHEVTADLETGGQLFAGKTFWVAQRCPSRLRILDDIKANGGEMVMREKLADYRIADHLRRDCAPGSISYEFVTKSIEQRELRNPADHPAGPPLGESREPGAINQPAKSGRAAYTAAEDSALYRWVRDAEAAGSLVSGNEIYKQLEAKHPRHTWQSWRDRYLKQLRNRPPSAFNIPDNAPPAPPSDQSNGPKPPVASSSRPVQEAVAKSTQSQPGTKVSGQGKARKQHDYTLDELTAMFSSRDWEELYGFVEAIDGMAGEEGYAASWLTWAEAQDNQSAEQWRQYYEKIVRPQWLRDPKSKRKQVKMKVISRHEERSRTQNPKSSRQQEPSQNPNKDVAATADVAVTASTISQQVKPTADKTAESEDERFEQVLTAKRDRPLPAAYAFYAREQKWLTWNAQPSLTHTELHKKLMSKWNLLSADHKALYIAMDQAETKQSADELATLPIKTKLPSSLTTRHESPRHATEVSEKAVKRTRDHDEPEEQNQPAGPSRPIKRRKSSSAIPTATAEAQQEDVLGTQQQPLEIASSETTSTSQTNSTDRRLDDQIIADMTQRGQLSTDQEDWHDPDNATESIESDELLDIDRLPPQPGDHNEQDVEELPSSTPTPRAMRQQRSNFDTQAILSSPTQDLFRSLLQPGGYRRTPRAQPDAQRSSSPTQHTESDASTTQSLQEFRRSLNDEDLSQAAHSRVQTALRPISLSPTPSSTSSTTSGDPDPPLSAEETEIFFAEQNADGFNDTVIVRALKRTRCRPLLAIEVLEAWQAGQSLPDQRGIWSAGDDEAVESGDGEALARLERKHTVDGWGGIVERVRFLEGWRSR